jgi:hypothetical protein
MGVGAIKATNHKATNEWTELVEELKRLEIKDVEITLNKLFNLSKSLFAITISPLQLELHKQIC